MNKSDLVNAIAEATGLTKKDSTAALEAFMDVVKSSLQKGETITLTGFGTFLVAVREAREGRNPQTNEKIQIPRTKVPKFRPGKALKEAVKASA